MIFSFPVLRRLPLHRSPTFTFILPVLVLDDGGDQRQRAGHKDTRRKRAATPVLRNNDEKTQGGGGEMAGKQEWRMMYLAVRSVIRPPEVVADVKNKLHKILDVFIECMRPMETHYSPLSVKK